MSYYLGIDGGGSNLRVALVGESLSPIVEARRGTVNPNVVGFDEAKALIQSAVEEVMIAGAPLRAVGIGIAGASLAHDWMRSVITEVLPDVPVTTALDVEIALVGALGAHEGVLVLAGTGSVAFGVNAAGQTAQAGGWGYLLGDEGSGYWLGVQALRAPASAPGAAPPAAVPVARLVRDGAGVALLNPKTTLFFAAFLPQFIDPQRSLLVQFAVMAGTFAVVEIVTEVLIAATAHRISPWLARVGRRFNQVCGGIFAAIGVALPLRG